MTRRAQLQALADWITRGPTPERVRLAAMLFPDGVEAIAVSSGLTVHQVRAYMEGRLSPSRRTAHIEWGWESLMDRLTEAYPAGFDEWDWCIEALGAIAEHRESPYTTQLNHRLRIGDARRDRLAARAAGWRLP